MLNFEVTRKSKFGKVKGLESLFLMKKIYHKTSNDPCPLGRGNLKIS